MHHRCNMSVEFLLYYLPHLRLTFHISKKYYENSVQHPQSLLENREKTFKLFGHQPCLWQIQVVEAILCHDRNIVYRGWKTLIFWMPLLFREDGIQIIMSPLNILRKQNVEDLAALEISRIALSAENATPANFKVNLQ